MKLHGHPKTVKWAEVEWEKKKHLIKFSNEDADLLDETNRFLEDVEVKYKFNSPKGKAIFSMLGARICGIDDETSVDSRLGDVIDAIYFSGRLDGRDEFVKEFCTERFCWDDISPNAIGKIKKIIEKDFEKFDKENG